MDYKEKYEQALKIAQETYNTQPMYREWLEKMFPELSESEDEKVRKMLIEQMERWHECALENNVVQDIKDSADAITWLEKQGKCKTDCHRNHQDANYPNGCIVLEDFNGGEGFYKLNLDYLNKKQVEEVEEMVRTWNKESKTSNENIKSCIGMCLTDANEQRFNDYNTTLKDCLDWLKKQGEQKPILDIEIPFGAKDSELQEATYYIPKGYYAEIEGDKVIIKKGEQKPFDYENANIQQKDFAPKEEIPRYNIGDVLCDKSCTTLNKESQSNFKITDIRNGMYICDSCSFPISQQGEYELVAKRIEQKPAWSEEEERYICQLESMVKERWALAEKAQDEEVIKNMSDLAFFLKTLNPNKKPSDEDMKTLLRTEYEKGRADTIAKMQKEWNEEDIIHLNNCISYMSRLNSSEMDWLKSLKDRVQPKQEWNEEDKDYYDAIIAKLEVTQEDAALTDNQMDFLKSLRPQNRWKPSDETIKVCEEVYADLLSAKGLLRRVLCGRRNN